MCCRVGIDGIGSTDGCFDTVSHAVHLFFLVQSTLYLPPSLSHTHTPTAGDEDEEDGDYTFGNSYSALVDHLRKDLQIEINTPIVSVQFSAVAGAVAGAEEDAEVEDRDEWTADEGIEAAMRFLEDQELKVFVDGADSVEKTEAAAKDKKVEDDSIVTITTAAGTVYRARKLVMTPSPHVINTKMIDFTPALPSEVVEAYDCTQMNNITKVIMKFTRPCWPKDLHGMIMVDDDFLLPEVWFRHVPDEVEEGEVRVDVML